MTDSASLEGWLMKQNHGLYRSWLKRYFVLQGRELSYYRNETDKEPQNVLDLDHYTISFKKQSRRHCTFVLVAEESHMQPDYYLQAETKEDLDIWVTHLQQHMSTSSVLDKWLERLDMNCAPSSQHETLSLHAPYQQQQQSQHQHQQQQQQQMQSQQYYPLRSHHSVESIHTYCSLPSLSHHRVSFTNDRRPSSQSTHSNSSTTSNISHGTSHTSPPQYRSTSTSTSNTTTTSTITSSTSSSNSSNTTTLSSSSSNGSTTRSFTSRLFSSRRQSPHPFHKQRSLDFCITSTSSPSTPSISTTTTMMKDQASSSNHSGLLDQVGMKLLHHHLNDTPSSLLDDTAAATLTTSIIHPSEYNHDDDPQERLRLRQIQQLDTYSS